MAARTTARGTRVGTTPARPRVRKVPIPVEEKPKLKPRVRRQRRVEDQAIEAMAESAFLVDTPPTVNAEPIQGLDPGLILDPNDPFDSAVIRLVAMNRKKRADYAADGDPFSNFRDSSDMGIAGFGPAESAEQLLRTKLARLKSLRLNGRNPLNESMIDSYLDIAVYGILTFCLADEREFFMTLQRINAENDQAL